MGQEITRAGDHDRNLYYDWLDGLSEAGYVTSPDELEGLRDSILKARDVDQLDGLLSGMPLPPRPRRPRDMGIPYNFIPPCTAGAVAGLFIAVVPSATMSGWHGTTANFVTVFTLLAGMVIFIASLVTMGVASGLWADGEENKTARRLRDRRGR